MSDFEKKLEKYFDLKLPTVPPPEENYVPIQ